MDTNQKKINSSWWERLAERCYATSTSALARDIKQEANASYYSLINDLEYTLENSFEQQIANQLTSKQSTHFSPAETLMPVMMKRFGLNENILTNSANFVALRNKCNACESVGDCWKAMRASAELVECRQLCPNANAFDILASQ